MISIFIGMLKSCWLMILIRIGSRERVLYIVFEPYLRRIVCMMIFDVANILTSMMFIKRVRAICGSK